MPAGRGVGGQGADRGCLGRPDDKYRKIQKLSKNKSTDTYIAGRSWWEAGGLSRGRLDTVKKKKKKGPKENVYDIKPTSASSFYSFPTHYPPPDSVWSRVDDKQPATPLITE